MKSTQTYGENTKPYWVMLDCVDPDLGDKEIHTKFLEMKYTELINTLILWYFYFMTLLYIEYKNCNVTIVCTVCRLHWWGVSYKKLIQGLSSQNTH